MNSPVAELCCGDDMLDFDHLLTKRCSFVAFLLVNDRANHKGGALLTDIRFEDSYLPFRDHLQTRRSGPFKDIPEGSQVRFTGKINRYPASMPEPGQEFNEEYKYGLTSIKDVQICS